MKKSTLFTLFFYGWLVTIIVLSSIPNLKNPDVEMLTNFDFRIDYILHFSVYVVLALLYGAKQVFKGEEITFNTLKKPFFWLILFAALEEGHQYFITGRTLNPVDFFYNVLGLTITFGVMILLWRWGNKRKNKLI